MKTSTLHSVVTAGAVALAAAALPATAGAQRLSFQSEDGRVLCSIISYDQVGCAVTTRRQTVNVPLYGPARYVTYNPYNVNRKVLRPNRYISWGGFRCEAPRSNRHRIDCWSLRGTGGFIASTSYLEVD